MMAETVRSTKPERFLFVIWEKAREFEPQLLQAISSRFKVIRQFEVVWPRRYFTANLASFYGWKDRFCWWNKARKCGRGPFLVVEVEDPAPKWARGDDTSGHDLVLNANVRDLKQTLRAMTGHSNRVHASMTREETVHELAALASIGEGGRIPFKPMQYRYGGGGLDPISMSFSISDNYSQHLAVVLTSILVNNPKSCFVFHVMHHNVSVENQTKVRELEHVYAHCKIMFHFIDAALFERFTVPPELEHITKETYFRYMLPNILVDEKRTIYADVDILCVGDIRRLWEQDLGGKVLGAVSEGQAGEPKKAMLSLEGDAPYFNAGVLLMDLDAMRDGGYTQKLMDNTIKYAGRIAWVDQDVINITFRNRILQVGREWNSVDQRYSPFRRDVRIWHFPGFTVKPWCNIWKNTTWIPYLKYLVKSPYRANAARFVWGHVKGFFYFKYTKKRMTRYLVCGILVWKCKGTA